MSKFFVIASDRRTGSYLLISILNSALGSQCAGVLRSAVEQWGNSPLERIEETITDAAIMDMFDACREKYCKNEQAVLGLKLYPTDIYLLKRYEQITGELPAKYVFLRRRDKIAQGLSITLFYHFDSLPHLETRYLAETIYKKQNIPVPVSPENMNIIMQHAITFYNREMMWQDFFKKHNIEPLEIFYEDFMEESDREEVVLRILDFLGADYELPLNLDTQYIKQTYPDRHPIYKKICKKINKINRF